MFHHLLRLPISYIISNFSGLASIADCTIFLIEFWEGEVLMLCYTVKYKQNMIFGQGWFAICATLDVC